MPNTVAVSASSARRLNGFPRNAASNMTRSWNHIAASEATWPVLASSERRPTGPIYFDLIAPLAQSSYDGLETTPKRHVEPVIWSPGGDTMTDFKMKGSELFDSHNHKVATLRGNDVLDEHSHKVATIRGSDILDEHNHKFASVKGSDILDEHNHKFASVNDVKKVIDGAMGGVSVVALWLFFVR
jgi:hypothetical protein